MQIYISKDNQQLGPFDETKVLEMLANNELSANDLGIRYGGEQWQKLGELFPTSINKPIIQTEIQPKKSRKGLLLGCGSFFLIALLVAGILGFLGYRNMFPADSPENLPEKVKDFKLNNRYPPKGNIWGSEVNFVGIYSDESKTKTVIYLMTVFASDSAAMDAMQKRLTETCRSGETPMRFSFDKSGVSMSEGATCAVPLLIRKDNKLVQLGGGGSDVETLITFAENLPFNAGSTMRKK